MVKVVSPENVGLLKEGCSTYLFNLQVVHDKGFGVGGLSPEDLYLPDAIGGDIPGDACGKGLLLGGEESDCRIEGSRKCTGSVGAILNG